MAEKITAEVEKEDDVTFEIIEEDPKKKSKETDQEDDDSDEPDDDQGSDEGDVEPEKDDGDQEDDVDGETAEEKRERRRRERQERKEKKRNYDRAKDLELQATRKMLSDMQKRLDAAERRSVSQDVTQIDTALRNAANAAAQYRQLVADAATKGDGETLALAQEKWYEASRAVEQLSELKKHAVRQPPRATIDPLVRSYGEDWMSRNRWYDPKRGDEDSRIALIIDTKVIEEGYDPATPEYWDELDRRLKRRLPHRYKQAAHRDGENRPRAVTGGSGKGSVSASSSSGTKITLSAERVAALKEAGAWDDVAKRNKMIKAYIAHDKAQKK